MSNPQPDILASLETLKEFFDHAHDVIHVLDQDGNIIYVNNSWKRLLGYSLEEIKGTSIYSVIHPGDLDQLVTYREQVMKGHKSEEDITIALIDKGGRKVYVEGFVLPKVVDGTVLYTSGIFRDITGRLQNELRLKQMNEALKQRENNLQQLLFNAPDAVIVIDKQSIITYWNPKAESMFGWSSAEAVGRRLTELIIPDIYKKAHEDGMRNYLQSGKAPILNRTMELTAINRQKREFYVSLTISTTSQKGEIAFIAFIRDIDQQKATERELEHKRLELESSNQELEKFAYVASHDIKEPVRKIRMFVERLKTDTFAGLSQESQKYINVIDRSAARLVDIVDGILTYSSLNAQKPVFERVDLNHVIQGIERDLELIIEEKKATIRYNDLPIINGSKFLLGQLFHNLIYNSLKFSRPDVTPLVEITATRDPAGAVLEIALADNGIGFSQEDADMIFDTFIRLNHKERYEGTGLGLSICKSIVEKHNGSIKAFGQVNSGATFIIQLPCA